MSTFDQGVQQQFLRNHHIAGTKVIANSFDAEHTSAFDNKTYYVTMTFGDWGGDLPNRKFAGHSQEEWYVSSMADPQRPIQDKFLAKSVLDSFFMTHWGITSSELIDTEAGTWVRKLSPNYATGKCCLARRTQNQRSRKK